MAKLLRHATILILGLLLCNTALGLPFRPLVQSFTTVDYNSSNQNWSVAQNSEGYVFVANTKGVLVYNGSTWTNLDLPINNPVRSVFVAKNDVVYIGANEEFGYLKIEGKEIIYVSLSKQLTDFTFKLDEIWNIIEWNDKIYFQSFASYFVYDGTTVSGFRTAETQPLNFIVHNQKIYAQGIDKGLLTFDGEKFTEIISRKDLANDDVVGILPSTNGMILATKNNALFHYNTTNNTLNKFHTQIDDKLKNSTINRSLLSKDTNYIIGTLSEGIYAVDKDGKLLWEVNMDNSGINNTVLGMHYDLQNNIWLALDNGIAKVYNSNIELLYPQYNLGMVYSYLPMGDNNYFATNQGLISYKNEKYSSILLDQTWDIDYLDNNIVCAHNKGTFIINGNKAVALNTQTGATCIKDISINGKAYLLQSSYNQFNIYGKQDENWKLLHPIKNSPELVKYFEIDYLGNIWAKKMYKGITKFSLTQKLDSAINVKTYNNFSDSTKKSINVMLLSGRVIFSDEKQFYAYNDIEDSVIPFDLLNNDLGSISNTYKVVEVNNNLHWFISNNYYSLVQVQDKHYKIIQQIELNRFKAPIEEYGNVYVDKEKKLSYLSFNGQLLRINHNFAPPIITPNIYITKSKFTDNEGITFTNSAKDIKFNYNNFEVGVSCPLFDENINKIRFVLKVDGKDSSISVNKFQENYNRLTYGKYEFRSEILDSHNNIISTTNYTFEILKPFYLSIFAFTLYFIGVTSILIGVIMYSNKRKTKLLMLERQRHKIVLRQKEKELITLKNKQLEEEVQQKSKELSNVAMANITNRELFVNIMEELQKHKEKGLNKMELNNLVKIIDKLIKGSEEDWTIFQANFDRVHENFFKKLREEFPQLTSTDLRLCAFLRLNQTTKDIARLMNISVRGVEAGRYRLRKKFDIDSDESLTGFIMGKVSANS